MSGDELYQIYYRWTSQLHKLVGTHLKEHVDVQYFPDHWIMKVYSGDAQEDMMTGWLGTTVPGFSRPHGEKSETIQLPRPEDDPTDEDLDATFRALCIAVAKVLGIQLSQLGLPEPPEKSMLNLQ